MNNRITLKSVKHSEFASQETNCYQAKVYFDGKLACVASNDGHGGCDNHHDIQQSVFGELLNYIATLPARVTKIENADGTLWECPQDLEGICADLLANILAEKHLKRLLKNRVVFINDSGRVYQTNTAKQPASLEAWIKQHQTKGDTVLNVLPFPDALRLFVAAPL